MASIGIRVLPGTHIAKAIRLIDGGMLTDDDPEAGYESNFTAAQVHATLAVAAFLGEICDKLDQINESLPMSGRGI